MSVSAATVTRLEKTAVDNGFDRELARQDDWLAYASTQAPLRIWLTAVDDDRLVLAVSQASVARALTDQATVFDGVLPQGAQAALLVPAASTLHHLVRRAFQLSRTLPDELLHVFEQQTAGLPRATEAERLVVERVGQNVFRAGLLEYWEGRCAVTGVAVTPLLRASHIKPWAACATDAERLDVFNGLLLVPNLDAAFDCGLITVADDGAVLVSDELSQADRRLLGVDREMRVCRLDLGHRAYLAFHRERVFRKPAGGGG